MKNRIFIWALIKIAAGLFFLFIKYDMWRGNVDFGFWDWTSIVIVCITVLGAFNDIHKVTHKTTEE